MEKFDNIPVDGDMNIIKRFETKVGDYDAVLERWKLEDETGSSVVFVTDEVIHLSDYELSTLVRNNFEMESLSLWVSRKPEYTFVTFDIKNI